MRTLLRRHWPEYLIEAGSLGAFMVSAAVFATLFEHPASPVHHAIGLAVLRRLLVGLGIGATAAIIVYSPWGKRSGAHLNPALTLTFLRLGKIAPGDALGYVTAQFLGALFGLGLASVALRGALSHPRIAYVVTRPGANGQWSALLAEALIAFILMLTVLVFSNRPNLNRYTGLVVALLLVLFITFEAPWSGMSLNPARSFASAFSAGHWAGLWIYFVGPPLGMLAAAETYRRLPGAHHVLCAKLHHDNDQPCLFRCDYPRPTEHMTHV